MVKTKVHDSTTAPWEPSVCADDDGSIVARSDRIHDLVPRVKLSISKKMDGIGFAVIATIKRVCVLAERKFRGGEINTDSGIHQESRTHDEEKKEQQKQDPQRNNEKQVGI